MKTISAWVQEWEESERGWGTRPDGYTVHRKKEDIATFFRAMRAREKKRYGDTVPDEYSRPTGEPFECEVDAKLVSEVGAGNWLPLDWRRPKGTRT